MSWVKPSPWPVSLSRIAPEWRNLYRSSVGLWPMWDRGGNARVNDVSFYRNHGVFTVAGTGGFETGPNGKVTRYISGGGADFVDTGVERINGIGLFADSGQAWTVVTRYRVASDVDGTIVARAVAFGDDRTFNIFSSSGDNNPGIYVRGDRLETAWGLDDDEYHTVFVSWDTSECRVSYDGLTGDQSKTVGAASENNGQRIIFGARTNGVGFPFVDGRIDFVYIFARALTDNEKIMIDDDFYGLIRKDDDYAAWRTVAAGATILLHLINRDGLQVHNAGIR